MAYIQSKLANLLFTKELDRRVHEITSAASHPGFASTNLQQAAPRMEGSRLREQVAGMVNLVAAQSSETGALPSLFAATAPIVRGGECYGPRGLFQGRGLPTRVRTAPQSHDTRTAARLWEVSEELTGVRFELPG
jgi:NAD(P)-dependent dehydrogenase (short-subunit alcohol dehydrogenase family)